MKRITLLSLFFLLSISLLSSAKRFPYNTMRTTYNNGKMTYTYAVGYVEVEMSKKIITICDNTGLILYAYKILSIQRIKSNGSKGTILKTTNRGNVITFYLWDGTTHITMQTDRGYINFLLL